MKCLAASQPFEVQATACPPIDASACSPCDLDGRPPQPCGTSTASGGPGVTRTRHALGASAGTVVIDYQMFTVPDRLDCYHDGVLVATTGGPVSGSGSLSWAYPGTGPTYCTVVVTGPPGTAWQYTVHCPT